MGINENVYNIIFFKLREISKLNIEDSEEFYINVQPLSYQKNELSFLEEDIDDVTKFYEDLGDFAKNANSLQFDIGRKTWDEGVTDPNEKLLFNKLEDILDRKMKLPTLDVELKNDFFQSSYFEEILMNEFKEYYEKWKSLKEIKIKYGGIKSGAYKGFLEEWNQDANKQSVETAVVKILEKRIKEVWEEKSEIKSKLDKNRKTIITGKSLQYDIIGTTFTPKNFYKSNSEWTHCKISKQEINKLIKANAKEFKILKEFNNNFVSIEFEFCFLSIVRDWMHLSFLESRLWISDDIISIYPKKLMFIRNIKYSQKPHQNTNKSGNSSMFKALINPVLSRSFISNKPTIATKEYLRRNIDKKTKVKFIKSISRKNSKASFKNMVNPESFSATIRPARIGRNPVTGEIIKIKAKRVVNPKNQIKFKIAIYSISKKPLPDAIVKLYNRGKEMDIELNRNNNIIEFGFKMNDFASMDTYSIKILHKDFEPKEIKIIDSEFQIISNVFNKSTYLKPKEFIETFALEEDTFLLLGCLGKTIQKNNEPIKGLKYF